MITYNLLNKFNEIAHFCTTRQGGVSVGNYASFNLSPFSGDKPENQQRNLEILSRHAGLSVENIVIPFQTHGTEIRIIDTLFSGKDLPEKKKFLYGVDALITNNLNICIGVTTADCVPLTFYDPAKRVVAVAHAGWRGTSGRIAEKTVLAMQEGFGTQPDDLRVVIGPSISVLVYNVGKDVYDHFEAAGFPVSAIFKTENEQLYLDLPKANQWLLLNAGIPLEQIEISGVCTYTNHEDFFSARRLGIQSGRMLSGIMLK